MNRFVVLAIAAALADFPFLQPAAAETWPDQPIHIVVPFTPGSATDVVARIVAVEMARKASASRSSSTTGPAPAARSARARSHEQSPAATRCSPTPRRIRSIPRSFPT